MGTLKQAHRHFAHGIHRCVDLITKPIKTVKVKHDGPGVYESKDFAKVVTKSTRGDDGMYLTVARIKGLVV